MIYFLPFVCPFTGVHLCLFNNFFWCLLFWLYASCMAWSSASSLPSPLLSTPSLPFFLFSPVCLERPPELCYLSSSPLNELNQHGFSASSLPVSPTALFLLPKLPPPPPLLLSSLCLFFQLSHVTCKTSTHLSISWCHEWQGKIHGKMYLWLSWGTYVIICKAWNIASVKQI